MDPNSSNPLAANLQLAELAGDPHYLLHQLRKTAPVAWVPAMQAWLVTRRDLAITIMRNPSLYTVDHPGFSTARIIGPSMLSLDGDDHLRHRAPFEGPFRRTAVQKRFTKQVRTAAAELLDNIAADGQAELIQAFAAPIAVKIMLVALGLPKTLLPNLWGWYDAIVDAVTRLTAGEEVSSAGREAFAALQASLQPVLEQEPDNSLLAAAASMAGRLTTTEIISNAAVLLFGGIETTAGMIANAVYLLLSNPAALMMVRANLALLPLAIEETLRLEPAAAVVDRYAVQDISLAGQAIAAGDLVRVSLAAANRDPATFPNPDQFDLQRSNLNAHLAFAQGPHVCLGLHLARLEAAEALTQLLRRLPQLRLASGTAAAVAARPRGLVFRKPESLQVVWNA